MARIYRKNPVVIVEKDGVVQSIFHMDWALLKTLKQNAKAKKVSIWSRWFSGFLKTF